MSTEIEKPNAIKAPLWGRNFIFLNLVNLFIFISFQMLAPTMPLYVGSLGGQVAVMGIVMGVFTFAAIAIRPFVGWALDAIGRKVVLIIGLAIFVISVLLYRWASTINILLVLRFIHGLGWGFSTTAAGTIAADVIPRPRLSEGMSYFGLSGIVAVAIGPVFGLFIINGPGFPMLFYTCTAIAAIALILTYGIRYEKTRTGLAVEPKNIQPAIRKSAFYEKSALGATAVMMLSNTAYGAIVTFVTVYAIQRGISNIGIFFTVYSIALALALPILGWLADRRGYTIVVIPGLILIVVAMVLLSQAQSLWLFLLTAIVYGIGFGAVQPNMQALAVADLPPNRRGAGSGTFYMGFDLGIGIGSVLWGAVSQAAGFSVMYLVAAIPVIFALLAYLLIVRKSKKR